jgi:hypothetical protein
MKNYLVVVLTIFFAALLVYQMMNSVNIFEGLENNESSDGKKSGTDCDCAQVYKNVGDITTLQNQVKQHTDDINDLKTTVNTLMTTKK